jgi:TonB-linked SusC/RagA family outer membrane protein
MENMKKTLFFLLSFMLSINLMAQTKTISGKVVDSTDETLIGATVIEVGAAKNGTVTDINGNFTLKVKQGTAVQVSYIGYLPTTVNVKDGNNFHVVLKADSKGLDEIVVTGYGGKQSRVNVTNSISKVKDETFKIGVFSNPAQALSGAVSGLRVIQSSGNPGAVPTIILRGGTNLDGTGSPLIIVDGQLRSSLSDINPEDIESMNVLKDAGATALYGARASNGVVIVTTKSGRIGHSEINVKAKLGSNYINQTHEFLNARDYLYWQRTAYKNTPWAPKTNLTGAQPMGTGNTYGSTMKWNVMGYDASNATQAELLTKGWELMDDPANAGKQLIFKNTNPADYNLNNPSTTQDYNINMSGGNDKGNYYAGLGYNYSTGVPVNSFYKRYSFIFNGGYQINKWLKSNSNFNYNRANWLSMPGSQSSEANYFGRILSVPMTARYVDEAGNPVVGTGAGDGNQNYQPNKWQINNQTDKFTMVQSLEAKLLKNLTLKGTANWYYSEDFYENFTKDYEDGPGNWKRTRSSSNQFNRDLSQTYNLVLNYNAEIAKNQNLDFMLGTEYYNTTTKGFFAAGEGAPTDDFQDLALTSSKEGKRSIDSWHTEYGIMSYFSRANYSYLGKYLLSGVFRYDGYSSLLGSNRWGFFPGLSAGWVFGKENFIKNAIPALSFGKLRASYGVNGNASSVVKPIYGLNRDNAIGFDPYTLQGSYNSAQYNGNVGYLIGTLPNPTLRWEKTTTSEFGADLSFFENRLNANFTYYNRLTTDKHASFSLPSTTGFSSITNNNGDFRNRGIEVELSGTILKTKDISFKMGANIAYNKNSIVKLPSNGLENNRQGGQQIYTGNSNDLTWVGGYQEGQEPGMIVGYKYEGLYRSKDEIPANLIVKSGQSSGKYQYGPAAYAALTTQQKANAIELMPGDAKWRDINGDGIIDSFDQIEIGNTTPHWIGGVNTTFSWKGLTFYGAVDFALGFKNYDNTTPWYLGDMQGTYSASTEVKDTWTESNPNAKYPRYVYADQLGTSNYYRNSTLFAYSGDYLAIRELSLSYTLPKIWTNKFGCQQLDLSITGQNLGYLCAAKVATPEVSRNGGTASGTGYPMPRTILFGVNFKF